ncbi:MAG: hypothetical protein IKQ46_00410 [Bacteroidales bacterium]|nr:hypothetical protein [Bacteroidales bacterium]
MSTTQESRYGKIFRTFKQDFTNSYNAAKAIQNAYSNPENFIYAFNSCALINVMNLSKENITAFDEFVKTRKCYSTSRVSDDFLILKEKQKRITKELDPAVINFINSSQKMESLLDSINRAIDNEDIKQQINELKTKWVESVNSTKKYFKQKSENSKKDNFYNLSVICENIDFSTSLSEDYEELKKEFEALLEKLHDYKKDCIASEKSTKTKATAKKSFSGYVSQDELDKKEFPGFFPGMSEYRISNKETDFVIFNELIKLADTQNKDIIFVVSQDFDSDWINPDTQETYEMYQSIFFKETGHAFKVILFNDFLENVIGISSDKLPETPDDTESTSNNSAQEDNDDSPSNDSQRDTAAAAKELLDAMQEAFLNLVKKRC